MDEIKTTEFEVESQLKRLVKDYKQTQIYKCDVNPSNQTIDNFIENTIRKSLNQIESKNPLISKTNKYKINFNY